MKKESSALNYRTDKKTDHTSQSELEQTEFLENVDRQTDRQTEQTDSRQTRQSEQTDKYTDRQKKTVLCLSISSDCQTNKKKTVRLFVCLS